MTLGARTLVTRGVEGNKSANGRQAVGDFHSGLFNVAWISSELFSRKHSNAKCFRPLSFFLTRVPSDPQRCTHLNPNWAPEVGNRKWNLCDGQTDWWVHSWGGPVCGWSLFSSHPPRGTGINQPINKCHCARTHLHTHTQQRTTTSTTARRRAKHQAFNLIFSNRLKVLSSATRRHSSLSPTFKTRDVRDDAFFFF